MAGVVNNAVGMMDEAYFVGRNVILDWLNSLCQLKLSKIEETASGAVACQVMDALFPGTVPMSKVNWGARTDYEFVSNYKVLQSVFTKLKIDRAIEVDRLIRARYQDNLEFMQWLLKFFEDNRSESVDSYDAVARRNKGKNVKLFKPAAGGAAKPSSRAARPAPRTTTQRAPAARGSPSAKENAREQNSTAVARKASEAESKLGDAQASVRALQEQIDQLTKDKADMQLQVEAHERERDFYFDKLRGVELLLQNYVGPDRDIVLDVLKVLYAAEDDVDGEAALAAAEAALAEAQEAGEAPQADQPEPTRGVDDAQDAAESKEGRAALDAPEPVEQSENTEPVYADEY